MLLRAYLDKKKLEAGCDEAGRGPLAGNVLAAAVILPKGFYHPLLNDSKKLTPAQRMTLAPIIMSEAIGFGVGAATAQEIDEVNILQATFLAMHRALDALIAQVAAKPDTLLIDGNRFAPYHDIPHHCIVKGDATYAAIAAASVLAKCTRDQEMLTYAKKYPHYGWETNMGYPTLAHRKAIALHGLTPYHRKTFAKKFLSTP